MIAGLVSAGIGCASTDAGSRSSNDSVALPGRTTLTIENSLQWPLEGEAGYVDQSTLLRIRVEFTGE